ncbi:hypothetical protein RTBOTA2_000027 [Rhodotorula toruloides]|uniref:Proteophosphoglycan ppg4 n=1 Tax=Rhodotorula toruloides TaxID=5286 RepID=A0A0K3CAT5_RHOTO|nr:hypothetical protein RTBOTA2_000027 [Rhodotorula toruloides]PRQ77265.1 hypothetical protein AAT19DRAFT_12683 [Rhodotorula toruloides]
MSASQFLPHTLDGSTVRELLAGVHSFFYPPPTAGFTVRVFILIAIIVATIVSALLFIALHVYHTRRSGKKVWFGRRIERPSGRLLVLHSRTTWTLSLVIWGGYSVAYSVIYWLVYAKEYSQRPLIVMRSFQGIPLYLGGWCVSWSGLQAFMLATESANEVVLPVPVANTLFLAGGIVNVSIVIALATADTVYSLRLYDRYLVLVNALQSLEARLNGRTPTIIDLFPLQAPTQAMLDAGAAVRPLSTALFAFGTCMPIMCLLVNLGRLALVRKLRVQIRDSVNLIPLSTDDGFLKSAGPVPPAQAHESASPARQTARDSSLSGPSPSGASDGPLSIDLKRPSSSSSTDKSPIPSPRSAPRTLSFGEVKRIANRDLEKSAGQIVSPASLQARKVVELKKAERDLILVTHFLAIICAFLAGYLLWITIIFSGVTPPSSWIKIEFASTFGNWFFFTIALFASIYLNVTTFALDSSHTKRAPPSEGNSGNHPNFTSLLRQIMPGSQSSELPHTATLNHGDPAHTPSDEEVGIVKEAEEGKPD